MKILHVIPSLSPSDGGPSVALPLMARSLVGHGVQVDVATTNDNGPDNRLDVPLGQRMERDGYGVFYFRRQTRFYKASLPLSRWLSAHVADYDLVHIHALFSHASNSAARHAARRGIPYIIRPLGVLNSWGMENRRPLLKTLSFQFVEKSTLLHAAAIHYTSQAEKSEAERAGVTTPAAVIPLGIDTTDFQKLPAPDIFLSRFPQAKGRKLVLFLSRLDPKKGPDLLIQAWAQLLEAQGSGPSPDWLLVMAGKGTPEYERDLQEHARQLGVSQNILWPGFLGGEDKLSAFSAATIYVLPSHSENFGLALIEAMAAGLPCLTTPGVALAEDIQDQSTGILCVVPAKAGPLAEGLSRLMRDDALQAQLGAGAKRMAFDHYSMPAMGAALKGLYESILAGREPART